MCGAAVCADAERCAHLYRPAPRVRCALCPVQADPDVPGALLCWRHWLAVPAGLQRQALAGEAVAAEVIAAADRFEPRPEPKMNAYYCEGCDSPSPADHLAAIVAGYRWRCDSCQSVRLHHKAPRSWRTRRAA